LTAQGSPRVIFKRAIERGNVLIAETTAREFALTLDEALQLVLLYSAYEPAKLERAALRRCRRKHEPVEARVCFSIGPKGESRRMRLWKHRARQLWLLLVGIFGVVGVSCVIEGIYWLAAVCVVGVAFCGWQTERLWNTTDDDY
jgi:hypothetical protein